jgi:hypothetical protein
LLKWFDKIVNLLCKLASVDQCASSDVTLPAGSSVVPDCAVLLAFATSPSTPSPKPSALHLAFSGTGRKIKPFDHILAIIKFKDNPNWLSIFIALIVFTHKCNSHNAATFNYPCKFTSIAQGNVLVKFYPWTHTVHNLLTTGLGSFWDKFLLDPWLGANCLTLASCGS